jgi:hypothetical protein
MTRHHTPSDSARRSPAGAPSVPEGLGARRAANGGKRKRSIAQWILMIAILILPW